MRVVKVTGVETHHYFAVVAVDGDDPSVGLPLMDEQGRTLVALTRERLEQEFVKRGGDGALIVIGMGDEKWKLFQAEVRWKLLT